MKIPIKTTKRSFSTVFAYLCAILLHVSVVPTLFAQDTTVVLQDHGIFEFDFSNLDNIRWQTRRHYRVLVGDTDDAEILRNVIAEVNRASDERLLDVNARILHRDGRVTFYPKDSFDLQPYEGGWSEFVCRIDTLLVGDTLDVRFVLQGKPSTDIVRWQIQQRFPVRESQMTFIVPEHTVYHDHSTAAGFLAAHRIIDSTITFGRSKMKLKGLTQTFANIPPIVDEPYAPPSNELIPAYWFRISDLALNQQLYMPSWTDQVVDLAVSDYFGKEYRSRSNYRWLLAEAAPVIRTKSSPRDAVLNLYEWVHEHFDWDGTYGLFPSVTLEEMQAHRVVNKAALNMALLALFQEVGLRAYPVLVTTTDVEPVHIEIPDVNQFSHFVIAVDIANESIFVDAGDPLLPLGWVDPVVRRSSAIMIRNFRGAWTEIPDFPSRSQLSIVLDVQPDLSATGTVTCRFEGYDAYNERHWFEEDRRAPYWKDRITALSPRARIDSVRFNNISNLWEPFENIVHFHIPPPPDDTLVLTPVFYSFFRENPLTDSVRSHPVFFPAAIDENVNLTLQFAAGLSLASKPSPLRMRTETGRGFLEYRSEKESRQLRDHFRVQLANSRFPVSEYPALFTFTQRTAHKLAEPYIIIRSQQP